MHMLFMSSLAMPCTLSGKIVIMAVNICMGYWSTI